MYPSLTVPEEDTVQITIESRYYTAWSRYFVDRLSIPENHVTIDQDVGRVTVTYGTGSEAYFHFTVYEVRVSNR